MGYFTWPKDNSADAEIEAAMTNLKLWLEVKDSTPPYNYLLGFAIHGIERAKEKLKEEGRVGPNDNF